MKPFVMTLAVVIATSLVATAQRTSEIPQLVRESFAVKFRNAQVKKWNKEKENYSAIFESENKKHEVTFTSDGKWVKTETKMKWRDIPESVKKAFERSKYFNWQKTAIMVIEMPGDPELFVIEVNNGSNLDADHYAFKDDYTLFFTTGGKLMKEEKNC